MATALASQLQALASVSDANRDSSSRRVGSARPSILFDPRQAADIDTATIFSLALSGLEELTTLDIRFVYYKKTLFSMESSQVERELQGQEFNVKLDASARAYLCLLSDFLLLTSAHQTLEYLIRRHKIHIHNVDDLIRSMLPYHETSLFVRVLQISQIENTRWHFLEGVKKSGAAPPRGLLVQQCLRDTAVLEAICESGHIMVTAGKSVRSKTLFSFSVVVIMEALAALPEIESNFVNKLLPYIMQCFGKGSLEESEVGGLMVIGTLADKVSLSEETVQLIFDLIAKLFNKEVQDVESDKLLHVAVMVMVKLMQTQSLRNFPSKAFKHFVKVRKFPELLSSIDKSFNAGNFIFLLTRSLVQYCVVSPHYGQALLQLINEVPLRGHAESMVLDLLNLAADSITQQDKPFEESKAFELKKLLLAIAENFPVELDIATKQFFELSGSEGNRKASMLKFLNSILDGTLHALMVESNQSICTSLEHSQAHIREVAVQRVSFIAKNNPKMKRVCSEALLRRLQDSELSVVYSVLTVEGLAQIVEGDQLLKSQVSILSRCIQLLETGSKPLKAEASTIGRCCLHFLAYDYLDANPDYAQRVGHVFLSHMLVFSKTRKLNLAALKCAKRVPWSYFGGLSGIGDELLRPDDRTGKESRAIWLHDLNRMVIAQLREALIANSDSLPLQLTSCAMNYERTKPLIVLVFSDCLSRAPEGLTWDLIKGFFTFLKQEWLHVESGEDFPSAKMNHSISIKDDIFSMASMKLLESEPRVMYPRLLQHCLYKLLSVVQLIDRGNNQEHKDSLQSMLEDLFVVFSSALSKSLFKEHVELLLKHISSSHLLFLSRFFNAEGGTVPITVQVHSLNILFSRSAAKRFAITDVQHAVPHLLVALANPVKAVRKGACECVKRIYEIWRESGGRLSTPDGPDFLELDTFENFLELLLEFQSSFVSDGDFLSIFLTSLLRSSDDQSERDVEGATFCRLNSSAKSSILLFILRNAVKLPIYAQYTLIVALKGAQHTLEQAFETKELMESLLKRWRAWKIDGLIGHDKKISHYEAELFKVLLQVHLNSSGTFSCRNGDASGMSWFQMLMEAISIDRGELDTVVAEICCVALSCLDTKMFEDLDETSQDILFKQLIGLMKNTPDSIQCAAKHALRKIHVHSSVVVRYTNGLLNRLSVSEESDTALLDEESDLSDGVNALLEFIISNEHMMNMHELVGSLFDILRQLAKLRATHMTAAGEEIENGKSVHTRTTNQMERLCSDYMQQLVLSAIEKIARFRRVQSESMERSYDVDFLVELIHATHDTATRNHCLSLLTVLAQLSPKHVLKHVIRVFSILGETTLIQDDSESYLVTEKLISAVVPTWLEKVQDPWLLLQILVKALHQIPSHRTIPLVRTTLRLMQESSSLHVLLFLLLEQSVTVPNSTAVLSHKRMRHSKIKTSTELDVHKWSEEFSSHICEQYALSIRLPGLVNLLKATQERVLHAQVQDASFRDQECERRWRLLDTVISFIWIQLQKIGLLGEIESDDNETVVRATFVGLLGEVLHLLQKISSASMHEKNIFLKIRSSIQDNAGHLLECITTLMAPASFAEGMIHLLKSGDAHMKTRVLQLVMAKMKPSDNSSQHLRGKQKTLSGTREEEVLSEDSVAAYGRLVVEIGGLLDCTRENDSSDVILAAVSALGSCTQRLATRIPSVFVSNMHILIKNFQHSRLSAVASLKCVAAIVSATGPLSLPSLNDLTMAVVRAAREVLHRTQENGTIDQVHSGESARVDLAIAILTVLEALVLNLGKFLSPYLEEILSLLILETDFYMNTNKNLRKKAEQVRSLLPKMIPARLLLDPLVRMYDQAVQRGESSTLACIEALSLLVSLLDRSSMALHYKKIFDLCLVAFDLRQRHPKSFTSVTAVETTVISLFTGLVLKLSESSFKPLFVKILEWAASETSDNGVVGNERIVHRNILLYRLVNQLADKLRSIFVPYFQFLLKGCVDNLTNVHDKETSKRRKKPRVTSELSQSVAVRAGLTTAEWHLRQLTISALHKCFLYDNIGFLDAQKFQMLLGPIIQQIVVEKPAKVDDAINTDEWIPSTQDMDEALIACLGQMAITAGTDLLWKPLNHEVLLCTRSNAVHAKLLSLQVVKFLVDHLKEDYLVLLPETIPFLAELLENQELTIVIKSQEIIKLLEDLSGESLSQYL